MTSNEIIVTEGSGNSNIIRLGIRKRSKSRGDSIIPGKESVLDPMVFSAASEPDAL